MASKLTLAATALFQISTSLKIKTIFNPSPPVYLSTLLPTFLSIMQLSPTITMASPSSDHPPSTKSTTPALPTTPTMAFTPNSATPIYFSTTTSTTQTTPTNSHPALATPGASLQSMAPTS